MARTPTTTRRPRRTKVEIQQEFADLQEETSKAEQETDSKTESFQKLKEDETRQAVEGLTVDAVVQRLSNLGLEVSKALSGLSEQLVQEVSLLSTVKDAVKLEKRELENLHKIDVAATAVDQLVGEHRLKTEEFEQEQGKLRAEWDEERRQREQDTKTYEETLKKQRQREVEDFEYKKTLERKKAQDKYEEEKRDLERANRDKQEELERSWKLREAALKEREEELARLRKESEEFPERLRKDVEKARADAVKATEQSFKHQLALLEKDRAAEKGVAELQIQALTDGRALQAAQVEGLQRQLDEAKRQVQEIAVKAIEGASGARALSHVNDIAMEQAKQRTPKA
ncbi:MAG: hypothetical protein HY303_21980 [Candidatus Wallbacteria bacterium]|nr:hypothetical protein [Candidatus Wallbacteria bacterium]